MVYAMIDVRELGLSNILTVRYNLYIQYFTENFSPTFSLFKNNMMDLFHPVELQLSIWHRKPLPHLAFFLSHLFFYLQFVIVFFFLSFFQEGMFRQMNSPAWTEEIQSRRKNELNVFIYLFCSFFFYRYVIDIYTGNLSRICSQRQAKKSK